MSSHHVRSPSHRVASLCLLCALLALALAGLNPPAARSAQLNPNGALSELSGGREPTQTQTTATTAPAESTSSSNTGTVVILAVGAAVVLLAGIAYMIIRDARRVAPAPDGQLLAAGSARDSAARLQRRRAKAKAARRQRKRNR